MLLFTGVFVSLSIQAQNTFPSTGSAGIGTTAPNASAALEIKSTTQGLLIPRMTKKLRDQVLSPTAGLLIYQTTNTPGFYYYTGSAWAIISSNAWSTTGNSGTSSATNFIGTLDSQALRFKVVNQKAGLLDFEPAKANTAFGYQSLNSNTGTKNTANGYLSLFVNTTGSWNVANGAEALYTNSTGYFNTATGYAALNKNTTGDRNVANGSYALTNNTTGRLNTATGVDAMLANTSGYNNVANGFEAMHNNTTGFYNTATGAGALYSDAEGVYNTAVGYNSLYSTIGSYTFELSSGSYNTSIGASAMYSNTYGEYNTALGSSALYSNVNGFNNTAVGYGADMGSSGLANSTSLGAGALATASNQVMLGNSSITSVKAAGSYVIYSDGRFKKNIKQDVPGLVFIKQLQPVTYNYDIHKLNDYINPEKSAQQNKQSAELNKINEDAISKKEHKLYTGFVAQDVEKVADKMGYDFSGVYKPQNDKDPYGLSYADFVVPLVKAVQELSAQNDSLNTKVLALESLKTENETLRSRLNIIEQKLGIASESKTSTAVTLSNASLGQNIPNPYNHTTQINYVLPQTYSTAKIIITDNNGRTLKEVNISGSGKGSVKIDASTLANGAYNYSLYVNEKLVGTKQMMIVK